MSATSVEDEHRAGCIFQDTILAADLVCWYVCGLSPLAMRLVHPHTALASPARPMADAHRRWHEIARPMLDSLLLIPRNRATRLLTARFDDLKTDTSKDRASRLRAIIALSHNFVGLRDLRRIIEHSGALRELIVENGVMGELAFRPALHHAHFSVADERAFAIAPDMRSLRIERWGGMLCHSRPADEIHVAPQAAARIRSLSISFRWCDGVGATAPLIGILASLPSLEVRR